MGKNNRLNNHWCGAVSRQTYLRIQQERLAAIQKNPHPENSPRRTLGEVLALNREIQRIKQEKEQKKNLNIIAGLDHINSSDEKEREEQILIWIDTNQELLDEDQEFNKQLELHIATTFKNEDFESQKLKTFYKLICLLNRKISFENLYHNSDTKEKLFKSIKQSPTQEQDSSLLLDTLIVAITRDTKKKRLMEYGKHDTQIVEITRDNESQEDLFRKFNELFNDFDSLLSEDRISLIKKIIRRTIELNQEINKNTQDMSSYDLEEEGRVVVIDSENNRSSIKEEIDPRKVINQLESYQQILYYLIKNSERNIRAPLFRVFINSFQVIPDKSAKAKHLSRNWSFDYAYLDILNDYDFSNETFLTQEWVKNDLKELMNFIIQSKCSIDLMNYAFIQSVTILNKLDHDDCQRFLVNILIRELEEEDYPVLNKVIKSEVLSKIDSNNNDFEQFIIKSFNNHLINIVKPKSREQNITLYNARQLCKDFFIALKNKQDQEESSDAEPENQEYNNELEENKKKICKILISSNDNFKKFVHDWIAEDPDFSLVIANCLDEQLKEELIKFYIRNPNYLLDLNLDSLENNAFYAWLKELRNTKGDQEPSS